MLSNYSVLSNNLSFDNYILLYESGVDVKDILPIRSNNPTVSETYKIFSLSNVSIKIINVKESYLHLIKLKKIEHFIKDLCSKSRDKDNVYFYMIPIQTVLGTIVGFIFRSVFHLPGLKRTYASVYSPFVDNIKKVPFMFGFYEDFKNFSKQDSCEPIVITEGVKDCIYLKQFYPYCLSNNTSKLGFNSYILRNLTDKIIIVYDNDTAGRESSFKEPYLLKKLGFYVERVPLDRDIKDPASYINYPTLENSFKHRLLRSINILRTV